MFLSAEKERQQGYSIVCDLGKETCGGHLVSEG